MSEVFQKIVKEHFEPRGFKISKVKGTKHWNVLHLYDPSEDKTYIAKGIMHIEGDEQLSPKKMDTAFRNEISVLSSLPNWWGFYLNDYFKEDAFRILVTPEIKNCKWSQYEGNDKEIAKSLYGQIEWLHRRNIAHNDLELKNILLTCDNTNAIIIDFEKSIVKASDAEMRNDYKQVLASLQETEQTKGIAKHLKKLSLGKAPLTRRITLGGKQKKKTAKRRRSM